MKFSEVREGADDGRNIVWCILFVEAQVQGTDRLESMGQCRSFSRRETMTLQVAQLKGPKARCPEVSERRYDFVPEFTAHVDASER
jgi:hypothetical protein